MEASAEEAQSIMEEYEGVFDDYAEMVVAREDHEEWLSLCVCVCVSQVVQFGYVTLFAAAFPMAATLALVNNIIEIRIDAMKMVTATQRAEYSVAADIGACCAVGLLDLRGSVFV